MTKGGVDVLYIKVLKVQFFAILDALLAVSLNFYTGRLHFLKEELLDSRLFFFKVCCIGHNNLTLSIFSQ